MIITKFFIDKARYKAGDEEGNRVVLEVDYDGGKYEIVEEDRTNVSMERLKEAAGAAAQDMLSRKHGVNLSGKLKT